MRQNFQVVDSEDDETEVPVASKPEREAAVQMLLLLLGTLSKRTLVALDNCFTLITVGSAFWLWSSIPNPSVQQIVALGIYALFVLAANIIVRKT